MQVQAEYIVAAAVALASLAIWTVVAIRIRRGLPVLPYQPRRRVPWQWFDLLIVVFANAVLGIAALWLACVVSGHDFQEAIATERAEPVQAEPVGGDEVDRAEELLREHPLVVLLQSRPHLGMFLFCALVAVIAAPLFEEFLFRLLLQGWLEAVENRLRRRFLWLRKSLPGAMPVLMVALLFAGQHSREPSPEPDVDLLITKMGAFAAAALLTLAFGVWLVRVRAGATVADLGIVPEKFWADVRLGVLTFVAIAAPIYTLQDLLARSFPNTVPDPVTLFFFAIALGVLYYRTHRIVAPIALHMSLNATSLIVAWIGVSS